jgi:adenylate kinase family enzyme
MKIHLLGASGAGVTTLGECLAETLGYPYFDSDRYYWELSEPPFTIRRNPEERDRLIRGDLSGQTDWILGGSVLNWGERWLSAFDLVVFLRIPSAIRIERLKKREAERYGAVIFSDPARSQQYRKFIEWASGYDTNTARGRTIAAHQQWLAKLSCPVLRLEGDLSAEQRTERVFEKVRNITTNNERK